MVAKEFIVLLVRSSEADLKLRVDEKRNQRLSKRVQEFRDSIYWNSRYRLLGYMISRQEVRLKNIINSRF